MRNILVPKYQQFNYFKLTDMSDMGQVNVSSHWYMYMKSSQFPSISKVTLEWQFD